MLFLNVYFAENMRRIPNPLKQASDKVNLVAMLLFIIERA